MNKNNMIIEEVGKGKTAKVVTCTKQEKVNLSVIMKSVCYKMNQPRKCEGKTRFLKLCQSN
jgi:spore coat polysaccharide biosynthesis predicted glycosyltransferase SpsG